MPQGQDENASFQVELISKIVDNANAVSGAMRLMGENVEEMAESNERMEKKFDELEKKIDTIIEDVNNSKILKFYKALSSIFNNIITKLITVILVPFILFILLYMIYFSIKGWPIFFKVISGGK